MNTIKIAIEINGQRYEKEYEHLFVMPNHFDELFIDAGIIDEEETLRAVTSAQEYMLDR